MSRKLGISVATRDHMARPLGLARAATRSGKETGVFLRSSPWSVDQAGNWPGVQYANPLDARRVRGDLRCTMGP
jgi:hypothetical protein